MVEVVFHIAFSGSPVQSETVVGAESHDEPFHAEPLAHLNVHVPGVLLKVEG